MIIPGHANIRKSIRFFLLFKLWTLGLKLGIKFNILHEYSEWKIKEISPGQQGRAGNIDNETSFIVWTQVQLSHDPMELGWGHNMGMWKINKTCTNILKNNRAKVTLVSIVVHGPLVFVERFSRFLYSTCLY